MMNSDNNYCNIKKISNYKKKEDYYMNKVVILQIKLVIMH